MKTSLSKKSALPEQNVLFLPDISKSGIPATIAGKKNAIFREDTEAESGRKLTDSSKDHNLSRNDVALFRNSLKHNICTDMLRQGFHESFSSLFTLIQEWDAHREAAGPGTGVWLRRPLREEPEKLRRLQYFLTAVETAQRAGQYEEVYENQVALACYFEDPEDRWMCQHFYRASLSTAQVLKADGGKREAEANFNMGRVYLDQGELDAALAHFKAFYELTAEKLWTDETGQTRHSQACRSLWRTYTLLADKMFEKQQHQPAISALLKAFEMAKEAGNKSIEGEAVYRVGKAYQQEEDQGTAKRYLNMYLEIATELGDVDSLGKAYRAIAKSLEREGKLDEAIQYLEKLVEVSHNDCHFEHLQDACMNLGIMFNSRSQYTKACEYFQKAYEVSGHLGDPLLLDRAQVHVGSARAHTMMSSYTNHITAAQSCNLQKLLSWKQSRSDAFAQVDGTEGPSSSS